MMGMANWLQWSAWFLKYFVFLYFTTFLMTLILAPPFLVRSSSRKSESKHAKGVKMCSHYFSGLFVVNYPSNAV